VDLEVAGSSPVAHPYKSLLNRYLRLPADVRPCWPRWQLVTGPGNRLRLRRRGIVFFRNDSPSLIAKKVAVNKTNKTKLDASAVAHSATFRSTCISNCSSRANHFDRRGVNAAVSREYSPLQYASTIPEWT
jgi:hypothetical protein